MLMFNVVHIAEQIQITVPNLVIDSKLLTAISYHLIEAFKRSYGYTVDRQFIITADIGEYEWLRKHYYFDSLVYSGYALTRIREKNNIEFRGYRPREFLLVIADYDDPLLTTFQDTLGYERTRFT